MSIEVPLKAGGIAHERSHPGKFNPDSDCDRTASGRRNQEIDWPVGGPIFFSLQLFLLKTTGVSLNNLIQIVYCSMQESSQLPSLVCDIVTALALTVHRLSRRHG